jgi:SAM-dependent methyltransferase
LSDCWGHDRGTPVDRYYIEHFVAQHRSDIHGSVLELEDSSYTDEYGDDVEQTDVLDINPANPAATIIADLAKADGVPSKRYDCFVLTQTLQYIYDTRAALFHAHRILRPGGVLLLTLPAVSRIDPLLVDYWRFTVASCASLLGDVFGAGSLSVRSYGNVLTAIAFLTGLAYEELSSHELEAHDKHFPVIIAARAVKQVS